MIGSRYISLIMVIFLLCILISKHHVIYLKYIQFLSVKNKILKTYLKQYFKSLTSRHHSQIEKEACPKKKKTTYYAVTCKQIVKEKKKQIYSAVFIIRPLLYKQKRWESISLHVCLMYRKFLEAYIGYLEMAATSGTGVKGGQTSHYTLLYLLNYLIPC